MDPLSDARYGVLSIPTYVLIDRAGTVVYITNEAGMTGPLQRRIAALVGQPHSTSH